MPTHIYIPPRQPPTLWDRATAHALEVCTAGYSVALGVMLLTRLPFTSLNGSLPLTGLPAYLLPALGAFVLLGGVIALSGLLIRRENVRRELNLEQTGWLMLFLGYTAYAVALITAGTTGMLTGATATFLAVASLWRFIALVYIERGLDPDNGRKSLRGARH